MIFLSYYFLFLHILRMVNTNGADGEHQWCERLALMVRMVDIHVKNLLQSKWKRLLTCYIVADSIRMMSDNK